MSAGQTLFHWIDLIWVPIAFVVVHKSLRLKAVAFVLACIFVLRIQVEAMDEFARPEGFLNLLHGPVFPRGVITYGIFIALYIWLSGYYRTLNPFIFMAASMTIFGIAFCVSSLIMLL